jgi:hypothetical protein
LDPHFNELFISEESSRDELFPMIGSVFCPISLESIQKARLRRFGPKPKITRDNQGLIGRIKRATSWIQRAEEAQAIETEEDLQGKYLALWVAFNALYSRSKESQLKEWKTIESYLNKIVQIDGDERQISHAFGKYEKKARNILKDEFLCDEYWHSTEPLKAIRKSLETQCSNIFDGNGKHKIYVAS